MRILYYLPSLYVSGGLERIITLKANFLAEQYGYDVIILTSEQQGRKPYYTLSEKVKHFDLNVVFDAGKEKSELIKIIKYPFRYYRFKYLFSKFLKKNKPDVTISTLRRELYFLNSIHDGSIKIGEFHVTRNFYHSNAIRANNLLAKLIKKCWGKLFIYNLRKLSLLILLTNEELLNWPELKNTIVIPNPLSIIPEKISDCLNKKVIAVGRYQYQKGFDLLIEAWELVHKSHPDWILSIYGEGARDSLMTQIRNLNLEQNCLLMPQVSNITDKYAESSIFVLSSRYEGFGLVICEAMACGVPPVSFNCSCGPKEIINDGEDGLLVENGNTKELAKKICYLIENKNLRIKMGKQARINVRRFSIENVMEQWGKLFENLQIHH